MSPTAKPIDDFVDFMCKVISAAAKRFDAKPIERAGVETRAELRGIKMELALVDDPNHCEKCKGWRCSSFCPCCDRCDHDHP